MPIVLQDGIRTAGILLHEGAGKGSPPTIEVLSVGTITSTRRSEDLLPCLPDFRKFFVRLPKTAAEMSLKPTKVSLLDVECVTKSLMKVNITAWYFKFRKGIDVQYRSISETY